MTTGRRAEGGSLWTSPNELTLGDFYEGTFGVGLKFSCNQAGSLGHSDPLLPHFTEGLESAAKLRRLVARKLEVDDRRVVERPFRDQQLTPDEKPLVSVFTVGRDG